MITDDKLLQLRSVIDPRLKTLNTVPDLIDYLFYRRRDYDRNLLTKFMEEDLVAEILVLSLTNFNQIEEELRKFAESRELKAGKVFWPVRIAVTGKTVALPLFEVIKALGEEEFTNRIKFALNTFQYNRGR